MYARVALAIRGGRSTSRVVAVQARVQEAPMGLLQRRLARKAAVIDGARWTWVAHKLTPEEQRLHNTPARVVFTDGMLTGFLFLTDRALLFADAPGHAAHFVLENIKMIEPSSGGSEFRIGVSTADGPAAFAFAMYPSLLSQAFYSDLVDLVALRHVPG